MLKFFLLFIAGSVIVFGMSIDTFFTTVYHGYNFNSVDITTEELSNILALLDLQTGVPANGYHFTDLTIL
jgi:hypothetical protein